ncbi:MAG: helix-turn-helix domain-containing protein [Brevinematales bacterium]|jgi:AraC-like DNA-binding protein
MIKFNKLLIPSALIPVLIAAPLAVCVCFILLSYKGDITVLPNINHYSIYEHNFDYFYDNSEILGFETTPDSVSLEYRLKKAYDTYPYIPYVPYIPFVGVWIDLGEFRFMDLEGYDYIRVRVKDAGSRSLQFNLFNFDNKLTVEHNMLSYNIMTYECALDNTDDNYIMPLDRFQVQQWWYTFHKIHENFSKYYDYSQIIWLEIQMGSNAPVGEKAAFTVYGITICQDHVLLFLRAAGCLGLFYILILLSIALIRRLNMKPVMVAYEKKDIGSRAEGEKNKISGYIACSYSDPELSQLKMARELGIHPVKIGSFMKGHFNLGFKQYLNLVRITEARRILTSSDLDIAEIAYAVGFSNVTHFNRTFKEMVHTTPMEYRRHGKP